jgi:hypothetical protein
LEAAPKPTQEEIAFVVEQARKRILRYLEECGLVAFAAAPGDGELELAFRTRIGPRPGTDPCAHAQDA